MSDALTTDILILGTGGAGLMAALHAFWRDPQLAELLTDHAAGVDLSHVALGRGSRPMDEGRRSGSRAGTLGASIRQAAVVRAADQGPR